MTRVARPYRLDLSLLGVCLGVVTDSGPLIEGLSRSLGSFRTEEPAASDDDDDIEVRLEDGPPVARTGDALLTLDPGSAVAQAHALVFRELLDRVDRFLVLHAAALARDGRTLLVAGPSGSGKTTLTLALLERGCRLLSDDFCPIERSTGLVHPFHKALGVRPGPGVELAGAALDASLSAGTGGAAAAGRTELTPDRLREDQLCHEPARPAAVVLFDGGPAMPDPAAPWLLEVHLTGSASPVIAEFGSIPGVRLADESGARLVFDIHPGPRVTERLESALENQRHRIVEYGTISGKPIPPGRPPRIDAIAPTAGLVLLLREVQNRRPGHALWRSIGGDPLRLATELAAPLAGVPFFWAVPGEPRATAALLDGLV